MNSECSIYYKEYNAKPAVLIHPMRVSKKGFTLIELSIVIVIIGLVIGGILVGRDLIKAAEVRSAVKDAGESFPAAVFAFKLKYNAMPGDMTNATSIFSGTQNGNGNGRIDYVLAAASGEEYSVWQHLSQANLVGGSFNGSALSLPNSKLNNSYYRMSYQTGVYGKSEHMISLNKLNTTYGLANTAVLSTAEAYAIDSKYDDGAADKGSIMGFRRHSWLRNQ